MGLSKLAVIILVGLGLILALQGQQLIAPPASTLNLHVCAWYTICGDGGCHDIPAGSGETVTFTGSRYPSSGGHSHTGGPIPTFSQNPITTNANGCVDEYTHLPSYAGIFNIQATTARFGSAYAQIWGNNPFVNRISLANADYYHPNNNFLGASAFQASITLRNVFYTLTYPGEPPYYLQVLRASNNWGGWLDGFLSVGTWSQTANTGETHEFGDEFDILTYPSGPGSVNKAFALSRAVIQAGCLMTNHNGWAHIRC